MSRIIYLALLLAISTSCAGDQHPLISPIGKIRAEVQRTGGKGLGQPSLTGFPETLEVKCLPRGGFIAIIR